jgi:hypothetical protein
MFYNLHAKQDAKMLVGEIGFCLTETFVMGVLVKFFFETRSESKKDKEKEVECENRQAVYKTEASNIIGIQLEKRNKLDFFCKKKRSKGFVSSLLFILNVILCHSTILSISFYFDVNIFFIQLLFINSTLKMLFGLKCSLFVFFLITAHSNSYL